MHNINENEMYSFYDTHIEHKNIIALKSKQHHNALLTLTLTEIN